MCVYSLLFFKETPSATVISTASGLSCLPGFLEAFALSKLLSFACVLVGVCALGLSVLLPGECVLGLSVLLPGEYVLGLSVLLPGECVLFVLLCGTISFPVLRFSATATVVVFARAAAASGPSVSEGTVSVLASVVFGVSSRSKSMTTELPPFGLGALVDGVGGVLQSFLVTVGISFSARHGSRFAREGVGIGATACVLHGGVLSAGSLVSQMSEKS